MPETIHVGPSADLAAGQKIMIDHDDRVIALFNIEGQFYAIDDVCTHDGGTLVDGEMDGHQVECPRHGARFDVRTGKALCMPATEPVTTHQVDVRDGQIYLTINDD